MPPVRARTRVPLQLQQELEDALVRAEQAEQRLAAGARQVGTAAASALPM